MQCHKTFRATTGTALYRLRTSAETVSLVVTLLAHGCPLQAIVVALGSTSARWQRGGHERAARARLSRSIWWSTREDLGKVQADEIRVKTQGGIVWMALAMMVKTRLWRPAR